MKLKFTPKKLDALADDYFRKADGGREDFSSREWIEIQELSGLALRRWAAQLRDEQKTQRARDRDCARLVEEAERAFFDAPSRLDARSVEAEAWAAFVEDPEPHSDLSDRDAAHATALFLLFYAAAKRSGDL